MPLFHVGDRYHHEPSRFLRTRTCGGGNAGLTGNEAQGMPADDPGACNLRFEIPMLGKADSLNAAVATAVAADEALAQKCLPRSVGPEG